MMKTNILQRRQFLKSTAATGLGLAILPSGVLSGANAPSNKLNVAMIGTWGRADAHFDAISSENIVALCDVDENHLAHAAKRFPKAKHYVDWRKCLEQKDIDAVICCTTDHTHAFIGNADTRILLRGTRDDIRAEVQRCMDVGKNCPGYILCVGNHIPSNTPVESCLYYNECYEELAGR